MLLVVGDFFQEACVETLSLVNLAPESTQAAPSVHNVPVELVYVGGTCFMLCKQQSISRILIRSH